MSYYNGANGSADLEVDFDRNVTRLYESISESQWDTSIADVGNNPNEAYQAKINDPFYSN